MQAEKKMMNKVQNDTDILQIEMQLAVLLLLTLHGYSSSSPR